MVFEVILCVLGRKHISDIKSMLATTKINLLVETCNVYYNWSAMLERIFFVKLSRL